MRTLTRLTFLLISIILTTSIHSQTYEAHPDDIYWSDQFYHPNGGSTYQETIARDLLDLDDRILIAGEFSIFGTTTGSNVISWDGDQYEALGEGLYESMATSVVEYAGRIYAASLDYAPDPDESWIYEWNGSDWNIMSPAIYGQVFEMIEWNGLLVVVGTFDSVGQTAAPNIAAWNGNEWLSLGTGTDGPCRTATIYQGMLVVAGSFSQAGATPTANIASWDGNEWSSMAHAMDMPIRNMVIFQDHLLIEGEFRTIDGDSVSFIARLGDDGWGPLVTGLDQRVTFLASDSDLLFGLLDSSIPCQWDGNQWHPIGTAMGGALYCSNVWNGEYITGGKLQLPGSFIEPGAAICRDEAWTYPHGLGLTGNISNLTSYGDRLIACGWLDCLPTRSNIGLLQFDGYDWGSVGDPDLGTIQITDTRQIDGKLYAVDWFPPAAERVLIWDGFNWDSLPIDLSGSLVSNIGVYESRPVIATNGYPENPALRLFIGSTLGWQQIGAIPHTGHGEDLFEFATYEGDLIIAGRFDSINGVEANNIARYDGAHWWPLGSGVDGGYYPAVSSIVNFKGKLAVTGSFSTAGTEPAICAAVWDGIKWEALVSSLKPRGDFTPFLMDITVYNEDLYVAGMFDTIDGTPASGVARYDGMRWHSLGSGVHTTSAYDKDYSFASSLQEYNGALYIGGEFERAGDKVSLNIARWEPKEPTSVDEPPDITTLPNRPLLSQNYPNPFNPGTTISYQLDQPGEVSLTIYNTLGQTVRVLADGFQTVGIHKIYWDGKSSGGHPVASGLYFYRLISSNETETRKMILLK